MFHIQAADPRSHRLLVFQASSLPEIDQVTRELGCVPQSVLWLPTTGPPQMIFQLQGLRQTQFLGVPEVLQHKHSGVLELCRKPRARL